jgi:hypothetical protein
MANAPEPVSHTRADILYDSVYSGAIGGSVVALFFLAVDAAGGRALYTPSLMGSVLFGGADAGAVSEVRLDMVAYYTLVHFAVFGVVGTLVSLLVHQVEIRSRHPAEVLVLLFLVLEGGFVVATQLLMPGVMQQLGAFRVLTANLLAAGGIAVFLIRSHRPELWQRIRRVALPG